MRNEGDQLSVARERRRKKHLGEPPRLSVVEERFGELAGAVEGRDLRKMLDLHGLAPLIAQLLQREAQFAFEGPLDSHVRHGVHDLADHVIAPPLPDVLPQRLAVAVRKEEVGAKRHLLDGRQVAVERGVAHPRLREDVIGAEREILRHALHHPERWLHLLQRLQSAAGSAASEDIVLERVHQLVGKHVLEAFEITGKGHEHAMPQRLRDTPCALAQITDDVVLPEVGARTKKNERLFLAELVIEHPRQASVRPLGHARRVVDDILLFRIVVHQEVLGLEHLPAKPVELHLILAEVHLGFGRDSGEDRSEYYGCHPKTHTPHADAPVDVTGTIAASLHSRSSW